MKRENTDYFEGFNKLFELAAGMEKPEDAPEFVRRSAELRNVLYRALINEFLPPVERGDILAMLNALHSLNLTAAEMSVTRAGYPNAAARLGGMMDRGGAMLALTEKAVKELRNFKKPSRLLESANSIHREYCSMVAELAGEKHTGTDWVRFLREKELLDKTKNFCRACERIARIAEQIVANNV